MSASTTTDLTAFRELLGPIIERIRQGAVQREQQHELPREAVAELYRAGLGRLRVPVELGGFGADFVTVAEILAEVAAADSNVPQVYRGHLAYAEHQLVQHRRGLDAAEWIERIVAGEGIGNAWSEAGKHALGTLSTTVSQRGDQWVLSGRKFYTTGSIYADWVDVTATGQDGETVTVLVPTSSEGVTILDDWDGFGQQLTGTGTIVFDDVVVRERDIQVFTERFSYQTALYQLVLNAVQAGIAQAVLDDAVHAVRERTRVYSHGNASLVRNDAQIQQVIGELSSTAFTAHAVLRAQAEELDRAAALETERGSEAHRLARAEAEVAADRAQVVLSRIVPEAATLLFNTLGASATSRSTALDRHWRNSRTVASHNPVIYKSRIIGAWEVNAAEPPYEWFIGVAPQDDAPSQQK